MSGSKRSRIRKSWISAQHHGGEKGRESFAARMKHPSRQDIHHQSLQNEQGCIMDPSQYSSQNRHVGPLGCSLGVVVAAVGDAMFSASESVCGRKNDTVACSSKCDDNQVADEGVQSFTYELPVTALGMVIFSFVQ
jgi:hypothetical protein